MTDIITQLRSLLGIPPAGLEFIEYVFGFLLVLIGIYFLYSIIRLFFNNILHM